MNMKTEVGAVILCAGKGSRIGVSKLKLEIKGRGFLERIVENLKKAGMEKVICVASPPEREWVEAKGLPILVAVNPRPERGMLSSLHCGIQNLKGLCGIMVVPVDHPLVRADTYGALRMAYQKHPRCVIKPMFQGKPGHPIIIPRRLARMVPAGDVPGGLGALVAHSGAGKVTVSVTDPGVLQNINTKNDLHFLEAENKNEPGHL